MTDTPEELQALLEELRARPEPKLPLDWMFNWMEGKWAHRILFLIGLGFYAWGMISDPIYFAASFGCWYWAWMLWEGYSAKQRKERLAAWRKEMDDAESRWRTAWTMHRVERLITPDWMY